MAFNDSDEFSAFDFDFFDKTEKPKQEEQAEMPQDDSPAASPASVPDAEPVPSAQPSDNLPDAAGMPEAYPTIEEEEIDYTVKMPEGPDFCDEETERQEERSKERAAAREEREKKREERRDAPKQQKPELPLSPQELLVMADDIEKHINAVVELGQPLRDFFADGNRKRPKGVKSAQRRLEEYTEAYRSTCTVLKALAAADSDRVLATVKELRLLKDIKNVERDGLRTEKAMNVTITQLITAFADHDDDEEAAAIARQLKQQAMRLDSPAEKLTDKLCDVIFQYPDENGELALFSFMASSAEAEDIQRIDDMLRKKGKMVVAVADAPAMIEAMKQNDQKTIQTILESMIDNMPAA